MEPHGVLLQYLPDGSRVEATLNGGAFDAVLLDVMMFGPGGLEVLRRIRAHSAVPVLRLTAKGDEADRGVGLEVGADDYIPKPFSPRELLARIRAVLRRARPALHDERLSGGGIVLDVGARRAEREGRALDLMMLPRPFQAVKSSWKMRGRKMPVRKRALWPLRWAERRWLARVDLLFFRPFTLPRDLARVWA